MASKHAQNPLLEIRRQARADDVSPSDAGPRQAATRTRRRCVRRSTASGRPPPGPSWRSWCAASPAAWLPPACSATTTWWWWAKTGRDCTPPCWPRSRWARCPCRCTRTRPPEYVFPINNADIGYAIVEDQEQVDKLLELREQCPRLKRIWFDDPRGLRNYDEPGLDSLDFLLAAGPGARQGAPDDCLRPKSGAASRRTWRRCSSPAAPPATPRVSCTRTSPCWTVPPRARPSTS
jgi:hypothetical protein